MYIEECVYGDIEGPQLQKDYVNIGQVHVAIRGSKDSHLPQDEQGPAKNNSTVHHQVKGSHDGSSVKEQKGQHSVTAVRYSHGKASRQVDQSKSKIPMNYGKQKLQKGHDKDQALPSKDAYDDIKPVHKLSKDVYDNIKIHQSSAMKYEQRGMPMQKDHGLSQYKYKRKTKDVEENEIKCGLVESGGKYQPLLKRHGGDREISQDDYESINPSQSRARAYRGGFDGVHDAEYTNVQNKPRRHPPF